MAGWFPAPCHCPQCDAPFEDEDWDGPVEPDENLIPENAVSVPSEPTVADIDRDWAIWLAWDSNSQ